MKEFIKKTWNEVNYEFIFFVILLIRFFSILPARIISWIAPGYVCSYKYGIIPRGFIGTIFNIVSNNNLTPENTYIFVYINTCIFMTLLAFLMGYLVRKVKKASGRNMCILVLVLYIFMPFSLTYLFRNPNYGRMDLYLYIITLIQFFILRHPNFFKMLIVTCLSVICVLIHEAYIFFVFPILVALVLYRMQKKGFNKSVFYGLVLLVISVLLTTYYIKFYLEPALPEMNAYIAELNDSTGMVIDEDAVIYEYYKKSLEDHKLFFWNRRGIENVIGIVISGFILIPVNIFIYKVMKEYFIKNKNTWLERLVILGAIGIVAYIPLYVVAIDWGRWSAALYNYVIVFLMFLVNDSREEFFEKIHKIVTNKELVLEKSSMLAYIILCIAVGPFQDVGFWSFIILLNPNYY